MIAPDGFEWQTRNTGRHTFRQGQRRCTFCNWGLWRDHLACPSAQERRLVGPWQPIEEAK